MTTRRARVRGGLAPVRWLTRCVVGIRRDGVVRYGVAFDPGQALRLGRTMAADLGWSGRVEAAVWGAVLWRPVEDGWVMASWRWRRHI
jgi:hypothetical protein